MSRFSWLRIEGRNIPFGTRGLHSASQGPIHTRGPIFLDLFMDSSYPLWEGDREAVYALPIDPLPPTSNRVHKIDLTGELFELLLHEQFLGANRFKYDGSSRSSLLLSFSQIEWLGKYGKSLCEREGDPARLGAEIQRCLSKWESQGGKTA